MNKKILFYSFLYIVMLEFINYEIHCRINARHLLFCIL